MISRLLACLLVVTHVGATAAERKPLLHKNARLAIIGDSITEQKLYSKFIETYLLACVGRKDVDCYQFGLSGEIALGLAGRVERDLRVFEPTVATLCYGMNDGLYQPFSPAIGKDYESNMRTVLTKLTAMGVTSIVVGSPGAVDTHFFSRIPPADYNANLAKLGEIGRNLAAEFKFAFADVHHAMLDPMTAAKKAIDETYEVAGPDGVHPGPNGHLLMASAFLKALGVDGMIAEINIDLSGNATASEGHVVVSSNGGKVEIESSRWPFCFETDPNLATSTRSILPFCKFNEELNRFMLRVTNLRGSKAKVSWSGDTQEFTREQLDKGVNLAAVFFETPFHEAFMNVMDAVAAKQAYESDTTWKALYTFRSQHADLSKPEAKKAFGELKKRVIEERTPMIEAARQSLTPVKHTITIVPVP